MSLPIDLNRFMKSRGFNNAHNRKVVAPVLKAAKLGKTGYKYGRTAHALSKTNLGRYVTSKSKLAIRKSLHGTKFKRKYNKGVAHTRHVSHHVAKLSSAVVSLNKGIQYLGHHGRTTGTVKRLQAFASEAAEAAEAIIPYAETAAEYAPLLML